MKPLTMDKSKYFLDLSKCTEDEQKHIFSLLPPEPHRDAYNIFRSYKYLQFIPKSKFQEKEKWMVDKQAFDKVELTYPEFIKLFEGGEESQKYDLEALAEDSVSEVTPEHGDYRFRGVYKEFFKEGFKKAMELNYNQ